MGDVVAALSALPSALLAETIEDAQNERRPLEILVGTKRGARSTNCIQRHQCQLRFPRNAFLEMVREVWVSAPELVFVQMASRLEYGALLALGYELCGCYPLGEGSGFQVRGPLTTPERLVAFSGQLGGARSAKLARSAAAASTKEVRFNYGDRSGYSCSDVSEARRLGLASRAA